MNPKLGSPSGGLPFSPLLWCRIAATRQGFPDGALRAALTGPGRDAENPSFLRGENGRLQMVRRLNRRPAQQPPTPPDLANLFGAENGLDFGGHLRFMQKIGIDVHLANPLKVKAIASARIKTDTIDAGVLCDLLRSNLLPEASRNPVQGPGVMVIRHPLMPAMV